MSTAIETFIKETLESSGKQTLVIAVSGGIDSAVSLTLAARAVGADHVHAVLMPYADQDMADARAILDFNQIPAINRHEFQIKPIVDACMAAVQLKQTSAPDSTDANADTELSAVRVGNMKARSRMILLYDMAKSLDALVCGTENKSEKYLGYFTRFGDAASDLEPISQLYKTQVFELAKTLAMPSQIIDKAPSAGLWQGQTDEAEFGFSYSDADAVLTIIVDKQPSLLERLTNGKTNSLQEVTEGVRFLSGATLEPALITKVLTRVQSQWFKHQVPFEI